MSVKAKAMRRIETEFKAMFSKASLYSIGKDDDSNNVFKWKTMIQDPDGTPYASGMFRLDIEFPEDYPFKPPKMLLSITVLLADPTPNDPLVPEIGQLFKNNRFQFD
ncbi:unnamed protein product [Arabidopsis thaliana]|uniref:(thale cress) hypothetical protein n=1 Tax=Arabidopsis thaliana TaxID=3702 RepID=A0A7G2DY44_ARATH|nr:unnamed protein product [Arabidopsis thaliana]